MPPIGKSDHDIVHIEYDIKAKGIRQTPESFFFFFFFFLYKRANMDGLRGHIAKFKDDFLSKDQANMSVNDMWADFKTIFLAVVVRYIPTKMTKTKYSLPWIDTQIKKNL